MRLDRDFRRRLVAGHRRCSLLARGIDNLAVLLGNDEGDHLCSQRFADAAANPAITNQHDLIAEQALVDGRW